MKALITSIALMVGLLGDKPNVVIMIADHKFSFSPDAYPKSIIDSYDGEERYDTLDDYHRAILINIPPMTDIVVDKMMLWKFRSIEPELSENYMTMLKKAFSENVPRARDPQSEFAEINVRKWVTDCRIQKAYGGEIYFDTLMGLPKPLKAYQIMYVELNQNGVIQISNDFAREEIRKEMAVIPIHHIPFTGDINDPYTWKKK